MAVGGYSARGGGWSIRSFTDSANACHLRSILSGLTMLGGIQDGQHREHDDRQRASLTLLTNLSLKAGDFVSQPYSRSINDAVCPWLVMRNTPGGTSGFRRTRPRLPGRRCSCSWASAIHAVTWRGGTDER